MKTRKGYCSAPFNIVNEIYISEVGLLGNLIDIISFLRFHRLLMRNILGLFFAVVATVLADEKPMALERLESSWEKAKEREFEKLSNVYIQQLEKLKKSYLRTENLQAAVACDDAIAEITGQKKRAVDVVRGVEVGKYTFKAGDTILRCPSGLKTELVELKAKGATWNLDYQPWNEDGSTWNCPSAGILELIHGKKGVKAQYRQIRGTLLFQGYDFDGKRKMRIAVVKSAK